MTERQRRQALVVCGRILETAAKLQADLREAKAVIEKELAEGGGLKAAPGTCPGNRTP